MLITGAVIGNRAPPALNNAVVPFWLPAAHFAAGLAFLVSVGLLLPFITRDLTAGRFLQPRVVAVIHLITLGWLTLSIMGALCQLFPVALGQPLHSIKGELVALVLFVPGLLIFSVSLFTGHLQLVGPGAFLFASGLLLFAGNALLTLARSKQRDLTWYGLAAAFGFLLATIAFGVSLALNLQNGNQNSGRLTAVAVHVHVALAGWVGLVIMSIARRLLPMFLLSHGAGERALKCAVIATIGGAALLALFHRAMNKVLFVSAAVLLATGSVLFAIQVAGYLKTRHRPKLDPGLRLAISGGVIAFAGVLLGLATLVIGWSPRLLATYGVALLGGLTLFVAGHYYKILPFLLWNHRFAPLVGKRELPRITDLYSASIASVAGVFAVAGIALLATGTFTRSAPIALIGAVSAAAGFVIEAVQLVGVLRTRVT